MSRQRRIWLSVVVVTALVGILAGVALGATASDKRITLDFKDSPVESALQSLFQGTGLNYVLAPGVTGTVTVSLRDMQFEPALRALLRPNLTYKVEDGVYVIRKKETADTSGSTAGGAGATTTSPAPSEVELPSAEVKIEKIPLNFADAMDIAAIFGAQNILSRSNTGGIGYGAGSGMGAYGIGSSMSGGMFGGGGYGSYGGYGGYGGSGVGGYGGFGGVGGGYGGYGGYSSYGSYGTGIYGR